MGEVKINIKLFITTKKGLCDKTERTANCAILLEVAVDHWSSVATYTSIAAY